MANASSHMCLKATFRDGFPWKHAGLTRDEFREWARHERQPPIHVGAHKWRPMRDGEPVPRPMVMAFSEYISDVLHLGRYPLSAIAEPCPPVQVLESQAPAREKNAWRLGWSDIFALIARQFTVTEDAYCQHEQDIELAARMVMHTYAFMSGKAPTEAAAIAFAEHAMKRSVAEYARMLLMLWKANENAVLFTAFRDKDGQSHRVGVSVIAPLSEAFYQRFRNGEAEDIDMTPADVPGKSLYQMVNAVGENQAIDVRRDKARRSMAQARTLLYQYASLAPPLYRGVANPRIITMATNEEFSLRLQSYSFRAVGTRTRCTDKPVMEFASPQMRKLGIGYPHALAQYLAMKSTLLVYQANIEAQHRLIAD